MEAHELNDLLLRSQLKQGADLKILVYYATAVPIGTPVRITATDVGRLVGLSTTSASRSIGRLAANGWLQLAYTAVGVKFYCLGHKAIGQPSAPEPTDEPGTPLATVRHLHSVQNPCPRA
ncbi:hypothetical protein ACIGMX_45245 [Streptomyces aquilus]|uniref:hypothetical protein n=1 Tax=Streptomyces aquilus TaxID=2548456 RepID=UPI0037CE98F7